MELAREDCFENRVVYNTGEWVNFYITSQTVPQDCQDHYRGMVESSHFTFYTDKIITSSAFKATISWEFFSISFRTSLIKVMVAEVLQKNTGRGFEHI